MQERDLNNEPMVTIDTEFLVRNAKTALATFVAPVLALGAVLGVVTSPRSDIAKAVARLRYPSRLSLHPTELALLAAKNDDQTVEELVTTLTAQSKDWNLKPEQVHPSSVHHGRRLRVGPTRPKIRHGKQR